MMCAILRWLGLSEAPAASATIIGRTTERQADADTEASRRELEIARCRIEQLHAIAHERRRQVIEFEGVSFEGGG